MLTGRGSPGDVPSRPNTAPSSGDRPSPLTHQSLPQYQYHGRERYDMHAADNNSGGKYATGTVVVIVLLSGDAQEPAYSRVCSSQLWLNIGNQVHYI